MNIGLGKRRWPARLVVGLFATVSLGACDNQSAAPPQALQPNPPLVEDPAMASATAGVWLHGIDILKASLVEAQNLAEAIRDFLASPSEAKLNGARLAWHRSHDAYGEYALFIAMSKSNPGLFGSLAKYDFAVEAWPIQPGYLDYYGVYTHSGIVNDIAMPLTAEALRQQHGFTDSSDVSLGFHSLEYLLWGENGGRPASDYLPAHLDEDQQRVGVRPVDLPRNRRRVLLELVANLLVDDIAAFKQAMENPDQALHRGYLSLQPYSRLTLFQNAGHVLLSQHRDLLQAQLDSGPEGDDYEELQHSPFAGGAPGNLAHSLQTVEQVLLGPENGLGNWLRPEHQAKLERLAQLRADLLRWHHQPWPPTEEKGRAMVGTLTELADLFEPESVSSL